jgi:MFS family permease
MRTWLFSLLLFFISATIVGFLPQNVFAQDESCGKLQESFNTYGGNYANVAGELPKFCNATSILQFTINLILSLVGGIVVIMLMVGGYNYITSSGNEEKATKGRQTVLWASIGLAVILMAAAIVNIVINAVVNDKLF